VSGRALPTHIEVGGIVRRAESAGDFGAILRKGDAERGSIMLVISSRGRHVACLERVLSLDGDYQWRPVGPSESASSADIAEFLAKRARFDEDSWTVELDIAAAERFIAETIAAG
jgi:hypothetical protein